MDVETIIKDENMKNNFVKTLWGAGFLFVVLLSAPGLSHGFELNGFGDIGYTVTEANTSGGSNNGFALGQLTFYVNEQISDRSSVLVEYVIESPGGGFVIDLERLQIDYELSDNHTLRAGRFHSLLGYWNTAFHHGAYLQTSVGRPFFLEFEDENGIVPVHTVGAWWDSSFDTGLGRIDLDLFVGNGVHLMADFSGMETAELNPSSAGDQDNDKAIAWSLSLAPKAVRGLNIGTSGQTGKVQIMDMPSMAMNDEIDQLLLSVDLTYFRGGTEFLSEYYTWSHDSEALSTSFDDTSAYYVQFGQKVGSNTPYVRYEVLSAKPDPYFNATGMTMAGMNRKKTVGIFGIRHDLSDTSSLKVEYRALDDNMDGAYNEGAVQWSFAF